MQGPKEVLRLSRNFIPSNWVHDYMTTSSTSSSASKSAPEYTAYPFDARGVARRFRHSAIFGALSALQPGEAMRFVNDHDPIPLLRQITERWGDAVEIIYQSREPGAIVIDFVVQNI